MGARARADVRVQPDARLAMPRDAPYRPDIDGLRAVAVWLVLSYHLGLLPLTAGYVGVDVFFVISGYVIARMIAAEIASPTGFSFARFYMRRAARLMPAMIAMSAVVLVAGWFLLGAFDYQALALSVRAANLIWSNWHFASVDSYFMPEPTAHPLLHTWSLSVEEQFYLMAPILLVAGLRRQRFWIAVAAACALSFAAAVQSATEVSSAAYFATQNRVFELGAGILLAVRPQTVWRRIAQPGLLAAVGLALIAGSAVLIGKSTWFPGPLALPTVIGTVLIILAGEASATNPVTRTLSRPMLVFNGRLSYSLYIWHWPLLWLAVLLAGRHLTLLESWLLASIVVAVSTASYYGLELPVRRMADRDPRGISLGAVTAAGLVVVAAGLIVASGGIVNRLPPQVAAMEREGRNRGASHLPCWTGTIWVCRLGARGDVQPTVLLWGDSHLAALSTTYDEILTDAGLTAQLFAGGGCAPVSKADGSSAQNVTCGAINRNVAAFLDQHPAVRHVVIAGRWAYYGSEVTRTTEPHLYMPDAVLQDLLPQTVRRLEARGLTVTLLGPIPELTERVGDKRVRAAMTGRAYDYALPLTAFLGRQKHNIAMLEAIATETRATVIWPHRTLCDARACKAIHNGKTLYVDLDHLNHHGGLLLKPKLQAEFRTRYGAQVAR